MYTCSFQFSPYARICLRFIGVRFKEHDGLIILLLTVDACKASKACAKHISRRHIGFCKIRTVRYVMLRRINC